MYKHSQIFHEGRFQDQPALQELGVYLAPTPQSYVKIAPSPHIQPLDQFGQRGAAGREELDVYERGVAECIIFASAIPFSIKIPFSLSISLQRPLKGHLASNLLLNFRHTRVSDTFSAVQYR